VREKQFDPEFRRLSPEKVNLLSKNKNQHPYLRSTDNKNNGERVKKKKENP